MEPRGGRTGAIGIERTVDVGFGGPRREPRIEGAHRFGGAAWLGES